MLIDTHAHMDDRRFDEDREAMITRAKAKGLKKVINVGYDLESSERSLALAQADSWIQCAVGYHPHDAKSATEEGLARIREMAALPEVVGIGEIGLDFYYDNSPRDIQREVFRQQIRLAKEANLPVIIHCRDAIQECYDILAEEDISEIGGIMHCYSGSYEMAMRFIDLGMYISLAGPVTFKNARSLKEVAEKIPLDRLLIETDSPYLTPDPYRGKRNEPAHVAYVAGEIANLRGMTADEIGEIAIKNAGILLKKLHLPD